MPSERDAALDAVARALDAADRIGVVGHVNPDGDALGSMIGLTLAARAAGKDAIASFSEPFVVPEPLSFLDLSTLVKPSAFPTNLDAAVAVDTSARDRVGDLAGAMEQAGTLVVVDHHISDGEWGDVVLVDSTAAATTELVYALLQRLGWPITEEVAKALYVGLVTDTGRFQYSNTSPETLEIAADLLRHGVKTDEIGQRLYEQAPFGYFQVVSRVLGRAVLDEDHAFVWSYVDGTDLDAADLGFHEIDDLIDLVRLPAAAQVACLLKVRKGGVVKGSLRSRGLVDVAQIAASLGGGGHHNAAGFTSTESVESVIEHVVAHLS